LANIRSAKKRARQAVVARARNTAQRSMYRTLIRNVVKAIDAKDKAKAEAAYKDMVPVVDRYATKGMIHKNKAARHKSRLAERIKALG
jgi:small subunit ribosomal protein S20